jgi:hypothetical protein
MREVVIQIPTFEAEQNIEIDVKINGRKRTIKYRVEIIDWEGDEPTTETRLDTIRSVIQERDRDWELIQIGAPIKQSVPIMFRKRMEIDQNQN